MENGIGKTNRKKKRSRERQRKDCEKERRGESAVGATCAFLWSVILAPTTSKLLSKVPKKGHVNVRNGHKSRTYTPL